MSRINRLSTLVVCIAVGAIAASAQEFQKPMPDTWYRLVTMYNGSDERVGRCIQYFPEGSAHPGLLWTAPPAVATDPAYDYQLWMFIPSPDNPDMYAIVCKAAPDGYVSALPTSYTAEGRWQYVTDPVSGDPDDKFDFELGGVYKGVDDTSGESYCDIYTDVQSANLIKYMNCAGPDQDYAVNVSRATVAMDSNEWMFRFSPKQQVSGVVTVAVEADSADEGAAPEIFDLCGRKVVNPGHGIYIVDGVKVVL